MMHTQDGRAVVRAASQRAAVDLLHRAGYSDITLYQFRTYSSLTRNRTELAVAKEPGVWVSTDRHSTRRSDYERKV